ncbi:MAG: lamin tail domain-containing protein [Ferruginibacter sp.]
MRKIISKTFGKSIVFFFLIFCTFQIKSKAQDSIFCAGQSWTSSLGSATTSDNCSVASTTNNAPATYPVGTTTVIWTVTDASGNIATASHTVTVADNQAPSITAPANVTVNNDSSPTPLADTSIKISQVYPGGGASTGAYLRDYVEIYNKSCADINIAGWSLAYGSTSGNYANTTGSVFTFPAGTIIGAKKYLLIECGAAGTSGTALPVAADLSTAALNMGGSSGKVGLFNTTISNVACASVVSSTLVDKLSWGTANCPEGTVKTAPTTVQVLVRNLGGETDAGNNSTDFTSTATSSAAPRNASSAANTAVPCSGGPLPVTFTSLTTLRELCGIKVDFKTENEINVHRFEIEVSKNGVNYEKVGTLAAGNFGNYKFKFDIISALASTNLFVRIKSIDLDGKYQYSSVSKVGGLCADSETKIIIFPNPAPTDISYFIIRNETGLFKGTYYISITDVSGRLVNRRKINLLNEKQFNYQYGLLPSGEYIVQILKENGEQLHSTKWQKL